MLGGLVSSFQPYLFPFLTGGFVVAGVKLLGNLFSTRLAAILATFPLGLLAGLSIASDAKFAAYLQNYPVMVVVLFVTACSYLFCHSKMKMARAEATAAALVVWAVAAGIAMFACMVEHDQAAEAAEDHRHKDAGDMRNMGGGGAAADRLFMGLGDWTAADEEELGGAGGVRARLGSGNSATGGGGGAPGQ